MPELRFRGIKAHYAAWGSGRPLLLLHAGGSSGAQWQRLASHLPDCCRFIAPDLIGCGASDAWPHAGQLSHDLQADLVAELIALESAEPVDLVGHSYGGATAVRLVLGRPHLVRKLVLIEPILTPLLRDAGDSLFEEYRRIAEGFMEHARAGRAEAGWSLFLDYRNGDGTWAAMGDRSRARFLAQTAQTVEGFISNLQNPTTLADCRGIRIPTTILCGEKTTAPDRRVTELLHEAVPGSRYVTIPGAMHMSPLTHPEDVAKIVCDHLELRAA